MRAEPVRRFAPGFRLFGESVVKHLDFDAIRQRRSRIVYTHKPFNGLWCCPDEHARITARLLVAPFDNHLKVFIFLCSSENACGMAGAMQDILLPGPRTFLAVYLCKIPSGQYSPAGLFIVDYCTNWLSICCLIFDATQAHDDWDEEPVDSQHVWN